MSTLGRQWPCYVDFGTVPMTQSSHTRSCFHRLCSINVCCKKRQLWVDRGCVMLILVPVPWPKVVILGLVFIVYVSSTYPVGNQLWVDSCRVMLILVPFPWPKVLILGLVFIVYVSSTYPVRNVNFGSTVAVLCWFWYRSNDPKFSYYVMFSSSMFHQRML